MIKKFLLIFLILSEIVLGGWHLESVDASAFPAISLFVHFKGFPTGSYPVIEDDGEIVGAKWEIVSSSPLDQLNVYFIIDNSGSMNPYIEDVKNSIITVSNVVSQLFSGDLVYHIVGFSDSMNYLSVTQNHEELLPLVRKTFENVGESFERPITIILNILEMENNPSILFLITDEEIHIEIDLLDSLESVLLSKGIPLFLITSGGLSENIVSLLSIARETGGGLFDYENAVFLADTLEELHEVYYQVTFNSHDLFTGFHEVKIGKTKANFFAAYKNPPKIQLEVPDSELVIPEGEELAISGTIIGPFDRLSAYLGAEPIEITVDGSSFGLSLFPTPGIHNLKIAASSIWGEDEKNIRIICERSTKIFFKVCLEWEKQDADLDLYVFEPDEYVYFLNPKNLGTLTEDSQKGPGKEIYTLAADAVVPGNYKIRVHYCRGEQPVSFRVTIFLEERKILEKEFTLSLSNEENNDPEGTGSDWMDVYEMSVK